MAGTMNRPSPYWDGDRYHTHFFCAICGGPFARVYRTDHGPGQTTTAADGTRAELEKPAEDRFSIPAHANHVLSAEELRENGNDPSLAHARKAYDGACITATDMEWTAELRALIHCGAQHQPGGGLVNATDRGDHVYLTGRGRVRQDASWADAHPSIHHDLDAEPEEGEADVNFADGDLSFHMYQEPNRHDRKFRISSIPFHANCWDILSQALLCAHVACRLPDPPQHETVTLTEIWSYLSDLIPVAVDGKLADLHVEELARGDAPEPITRLAMGCVGGRGYREAQVCGDGKTWLHLEGLHWLAVNPRRTLKFVSLWPSARSRAGTGARLRHQPRDPFAGLPHEVLAEVMTHLSCTEVLRWRVASAATFAVEIPTREYQRFLREEMRFLPGFHHKLEAAVKQDRSVRLDWRQMFEKYAAACLQNSGLRNRRRIWRIVQPMAEAMVETSQHRLRVMGGWPAGDAPSITMARGSTGVRSGQEGHRQTVLFAQAPRVARDAGEGGPSPTVSAGSHASAPLPEESRVLGPRHFAHALDGIRVWLDLDGGHVRGFEFDFFVDSPPPNDIEGPLRRRFGTRTAHVTRVPMVSPASACTGLVVCWYDGCVRGIQFVFEDLTCMATEFCENETMSPRLGTWRGPARRLVAPRMYRTLAGFSGFVNAAGNIESLAILEEKLSVPIAEGPRVLWPPDTVPLSHQEASLWAKVPPNDVCLLEREGPRVHDWRLWSAQHEIIERTAFCGPPGVLERISCHAADAHLTGLRFTYRDTHGEAHHHDLGACTGAPQTSVAFSELDEITAAAISYGEGGVHSVQLLTSHLVGPATSERYLGRQSIYAQDPLIPREKAKWGRLTYLRLPIIGFHCLYDDERQRIRQLGLVTRPEMMDRHTPAGWSSSGTGTPRGQASDALSLRPPLVETDELRHPWADGAPPSNIFIPGRKHSDSLKSIATPIGATYTGWIDLRHGITRLIIYGEMEGIQCVYGSPDRADMHFGNTRLASSHLGYESHKSGRRIVGIAREAAVTASRGHDPDAPRVPGIRLLNGEEMMQPAWDLEVSSECLAGIQFHFSAQRIVDWRPLFAFSHLPKGRRSALCKAEHLRNHWKTPLVAHAWPLAETDEEVQGKFGVLADFFAEPDGSGRVDGVRGYVRYQRFCGLRFRRHGVWDEVGLGQMSPYETEFLLQSGEHFTSIYVSETAQFGSGGALALCTNQGRSTSWIGYSLSGVSVCKSAPIGRKMVGIYLTYSDPERCDSIGIIHNEAAGHQTRGPGSKVVPPPPSEVPMHDPTTDLEWAVNPRHVPKAYDVESGLFFQHRIRWAPQRAYTLFEPGRLQHVDAYLNTVRGRYGLKALRFRGDGSMGTILLGDWQVRFARLTGSHIMSIAGAAGERIVTIRLVFYDARELGMRIIGLELQTDRGRIQDVADWTDYTSAPPPEARLIRRELKCPRLREIVGFHYVIGLYVHDIGLITRKRATEGMRPSDFSSHLELLAYYHDQYAAGITDGRFAPYLYPQQLLSPLLYLLYLLVPQRRFPLARYLRFPLFGYIIVNEITTILWCKSPSTAVGYGIGIISVWGLEWSAALLFFNDPQKDFRRVEKITTLPETSTQPASVDEPTALASNGSATGTETANGVLSRTKHPIRDSKTPTGVNGSTTAPVLGPRYFWQSYPDSLGARVDWSLDLISNFRGSGWNWEISGMGGPPPHIQTHLSGKKSAWHGAGDYFQGSSGTFRYVDREKLLRRKYLTLGLGYLALDVCKVVMMSDRFFWGFLDAEPPMHLPAIMRASPLLVKSYRLLLSLLGVYTALQVIFSLAPLVFVGWLGPRWLGERGEAWEYPDMFGSFSTILHNGLAGFWSNWWHQIFRVGFGAPSKWIIERYGWNPRSMAAKVLQLVIAFTFSGMIHLCGSYTQVAESRPVFGSFMFFFVQAFGIMIQMRCTAALKQAGIRDQIPSGVRQASNFLFVFGWLFLTSPLLVNDLARTGVWLFEPVPISLVRGLQGEGWFWWQGWRGGWAWWHRGDTWWTTGLAV
ncbi:MAG: hypothetical protein M1838_004400 [Thelocarpon superellum]|nr:MAG: hypothetical protein M1838_004400 [Thelocarpon superellum]